jgi:hypothetical protein
MFTDKVRLRFIMQDVDSYFKVDKDRYEYAIDIAVDNGREEPNEDDEYEGFLAMVDEAIVQHKFKG